MKKPNPKEPAILRTNLKFVRPGFTPAQRRKNEALKILQVSNYLEWLSFGIIAEQTYVTAIHPNGIHVTFSYQESELDIQKYFTVTKADGGKSNITLLRKMYPKN